MKATKLEAFPAREPPPCRQCRVKSPAPNGWRDDLCPTCRGALLFAADHGRMPPMAVKA